MILFHHSVMSPDSYGFVLPAVFLHVYKVLGFQISLASYALKHERAENCHNPSQMMLLKVERLSPTPKCYIHWVPRGSELAVMMTANATKLLRSDVWKTKQDQQVRLLCYLSRIYAALLHVGTGAERINQMWSRWTANTADALESFVAFVNYSELERLSTIVKLELHRKRNERWRRKKTIALYGQC